MNKIYRSVTLLALVFMFVGQSYADVPVGTKPKKRAVKENRAVGCLRPTAYNFLTINNVKSRINTGGNMWYPPGESLPQYFVPANSSKTSLFSGAIWIGGLDLNGQLKIAAQTFGSSGVNYWTGPLTVDGTAAVDKATCAQYDKQWVITKAEVQLFRAWFNSKNKAEEFPNYQVPDVILNWPAHGNTSKKQSYYMAPFFDVDGDGTYNPLEGGDYPYYDFKNELCPNQFQGIPDYVPDPTPDTEDGTIKGGLLVDQVLKGDQTIWWVMNDKGGAHEDPDGAAIGVEMRSQAFSFATNDEINNMTFFSYEIINRSTYTLTQTYFAPWTDPDLGYAFDDYVGCDVGRGLGYCYNGRDVDGTGQVNAYGDQPPAVGIDFFQGPYMDPDGIDNPKYSYDSVGGELVQNQMVDASINGVNFGNNIVDDERFGMRRFVYYNNDWSSNGNPKEAGEYYNYLRGIWKNNARMQYGGDGFTTGTVGPAADFMFPGDSDPWNWGTGGNPPGGGYNQNGKYWTEEEVGNPPDDRRFVQSAGPFSLRPGAVNYITFGIPWARATAGGAKASVELLRVVDDKCQALFDNCFKILDGPDAPDMTIKECDKQLIFMLSNDKYSNNYNESYNEQDITIVRPDSIPAEGYDSTYTFEGYQIFQLKSADVSVESLHDPALARLVAQFDIKNNVTKLVNYNYNEKIGAAVPVVEVEGKNRGIQNTFRITEDAFATGDKTLVNNKEYYYLALAYAYNQFAPYSVDPGNTEGLLGQTKPYLAGRNNIKVYPAIPHKNLGGVVVNAKYGDQPQITRIEGKGNGGLFTRLTEATIDEIMSKSPSDSNNRLGNADYPIAYHPVYEPGAGPLAVKVVDPLSLQNVDFELRLDSLYPRYRTHLTNYPGLVVKPPLYNITDTATMWVSPWYLKDVTNNKNYSSDTAIITPIDRVLPEYGIAINMDQVYQPGKYTVGVYLDQDKYEPYKSILANKNGYVSSSITFADKSGDKDWLMGIPDTDDGGPFDWIRAGLATGDIPPTSAQSPPSNKYDPDGIYEHVIEGTWAPIMLTTDVKTSNGPAIYANSTKWHGQYDVHMSNLSSVRVVFTSDKSKWTRSPVVELQTNPNLAEGNAKLFTLRHSPSIDKDGNFAQPGSGDSKDPMDANYISDSGMGWFPGYAIDVETGERLNIIYGEDSWLSAQNGRDMKWNPTSDVFDPVSGEIVMGGKHFIYLMKTGHSRKLSQVIKKEIIFPAYDAGQSVKLLDDFAKEKPAISPFIRKGIVSMLSWTSMPLLNPDHSLLETDVTVDINIGKPYTRYLTYNNPLSDSLEQGNLNNHYPLYKFSTSNMAPRISTDDNVIESALDEIKVVPNPYYAYSAYEKEPLDNRVKITNLPAKCKISIYNLAGIQVRQFNKNNSDTYYEWDLKNFAGVQIAGGMYVIYIEADINGKKYGHVVKWLGMMRKPDMNSF